MTEITFTDELVVELVKSDFSDGWPCFSAWTSTKGDEATPEVKAGLINRLIKDRHGTPFEHMNATFRVTAPICVWREHHRHRAGFSYNEESGRYKKLAPRFYIPGPERPLQVVEGTKQMDYITAPGTQEQYDKMVDSFKQSNEFSYAKYEEMLNAGILREVARMVLPVNIMSTCIVTTNARALMNFLSLRIYDEFAMFPSKPMIEIQLVAEGYEMMFQQWAPVTYEAYIKNRRVGP